MKRQSGILLPIYALPSKYGCGTLGKEAFEFAAQLAKAGQSVWQILPAGPADTDGSPYRAVSSFAGNPLFIDLDILLKDGLLEEKEYCNLDFGGNPQFVDYKKIIVNKYYVLRFAYNRGCRLPEFEEFKKHEAFWLKDFALYMAAKDHFDGLCWTQWPDAALRAHESSAVEEYSKLLAAEIDFYSFIQFEFYKQWNAFRAYVNSLGIRLLGDIPVYVPLDSSDVWSSKEFFALDENYLPREVSGVPPDYFNEEGQLWGNPLYDWEALRNDGYGWWIRRFDAVLKLVDTVRIDHFRGFDSYWAVPYGEASAKNGQWRQGPGLDFVQRMLQWFGKERFVAEDLGIITPSVASLLKDSGLPGMKVLQFAFSPDRKSSYLPHNYDNNCICYTGTHDNTTLSAWFSEAPQDELDFAKKYLNLTAEEGYNFGMIRGGMQSPANLFIAQMQDWLCLGADARTNIPGNPCGNWRWRLLPGQFDNALADKIRCLTKLYGRCYYTE